MVVLPGVNDEGSPGFMALMGHANTVLADMVGEGAGAKADYFFGGGCGWVACSLVGGTMFFNRM